MTTTECVTTMNRKDKLQSLMAQMSDGLLEREHQVRLMLLAALSGEHVLLVGPPGTAKSELAKRLKNAFVEANYFERLVTRFSVPEELFGPLSIRALEEDRYNRLTSGYLPEASVAFIDEIFKANSAILNSLLTLLNERQFDNGNRRVNVPLISVVAASNELPEGEELNALYDRFILRSYVLPVSDESFVQFLSGTLNEFDPELNIRLKLDDLDEVQKLAEKVELTAATIEACKEFKNYLKSQDIKVSDRRWRKLVKLMKVSAFTSGFNVTSIYDTWILPHCLWEQPEQFEGLQELYKRLVTVDGKAPPSRLMQVIKAWEERLKEDQQTHKQDAQGRPLFLDRDGEETEKEVSQYQKKDVRGSLLYRDDYNKRETTEKENYYIGGKNKPIIEEVKNTPISLNRSFSKAHIEGRVKEIQSIRNNIETHHNHVNKELSEVSEYFNQHLWLDQSLLSEVTDALHASIKEVDKLLKRVTSLESGFKNLPLEAEPVLTLEREGSDVIEGELCDE
ncbi:AAA family ATPase [Vibrio parahaemolyticus]|uniref:AAA family ATPase n=1 Tax=Vibrio parahaemolyticus TaxID=670 RepID=UPI000408C285|nr:AAA family ATPase [Vibrio parahaemolyticus]EKA6052958.1 AAA family ATPase [Vibrio parahaemolyticus]ELB2245856.1 AAA family ATPase [Vibrio parahaemolyticus]MCF9173858.1 AAA family ATPase [Vibrio parahaemolyticus]MCF9186782.1 AAA family ATPase [Vibrio parahaemolyticus]MCF9201880.1 AAA family ATPase [Vibrio parahaemolyticus]